MINLRLNLVAFALLFGFNLWAWFVFQQARTDEMVVSREFEDVSKAVSTLLELERQNNSQLAISSSRVDYIGDLKEAFSNAQIAYRGNSSLTSIPVRSEFDVEIRSIQNPIKAPATMRQIVEFIRSLYTSETRYNVGSLLLTPDSQSGGTRELWIAEFELFYCQHVGNQ